MCVYNNFSILIVQTSQLLIYMEMCINTVLHASY